MNPKHEGICDPKKYHQKLISSPLGVYLASSENYRMIPASTTPLVVAEDLWRRTSESFILVLSALEKTVVYLRSQPHWLSWLLSPLTSLEKTAALGDIPIKISDLATIRGDFFFSSDNNLQLLEVNTTIPAMQAYTDMINMAYAHSCGVPNPSPSHSDDLLTSLLHCYHMASEKRSRKQKPTIAIVSRDGDSQLAELHWLRNTWEQRFGFEVFCTTPKKLAINGIEMILDSKHIDLVYRHIFASRLDPGSALFSALQQRNVYDVFNPIAAHYEVKGLLGFLSWAADDPDYFKDMRLDPDERLATQTLVPWTRPLVQRILPLALQMDPKEMVVKQSSGYGGHSVILGDSFETEEVQAFVRSMTGTKESVRWTDFLNWCSQSSQYWIIQKRVLGKQVTHEYLSSQGEIKTETSYVDCSGFWSQNTKSSKMLGGTARFAKSPIVNIGRGGGMMPFQMIRANAGPSYP